MRLATDRSILPAVMLPKEPGKPKEQERRAPAERVASLVEWYRAKTLEGKH